MPDRFSRTKIIFGPSAMEALARSRVAVFGIGGVGGAAAEALARGGLGAIDLIDSDRVSITNINRQIYALSGTVGRYKTDVARERCLDINPNLIVTTYNTFYTPETAGEFDFSKYDYIVDAIDTIKGKLCLIENARAAGVPVISSMGAGNKLDPTAFEVADIYDTSVCPLARVMRRELKRRGIDSLKTVYSKEPPLSFADGQTPDDEMLSHSRHAPGSVSFVPPVVGFIMAGEVIKDIINKNKKEGEVSENDTDE
ncbi:MAG: tRNA threonylcarbamoyladenosine dehydratase [Clostridia bacterium]|nr:tRNA threonylcarbamoyladenosine dehydratase [Clostridia bacterium]